MPISSERSLSVWKSDTELVQYPPLAGAASAEVCVIGAGIAGMSVAYHLARAGQSVIVLDDNAVGGGETGQTTAHLTSAMDDFYQVLEKVHGKDGARIARESHQGAIDTIERIVRDEGIECDVVVLPREGLFASTAEPGFLSDQVLMDVSMHPLATWHLQQADLAGRILLPVGVDSIELFGPPLAPGTWLISRGWVKSP